MKIAIIAFTDCGNILLGKIVSTFKETFVVHDKSKKPIRAFLKYAFYECNAIVFIGAVGIATRLISTLIVSKDKDPAVIVIDEQGQFVIPILSGHIGGANRLSLRLAKLLSAIPVITTATDINGLFSVDDWSSVNGCVIDELPKFKTIATQVLADQTVGFYSDFEIEGTVPKELQVVKSGMVGVCISLDQNLKPFKNTLNIIPKIVTIGVGCKKNTAFKDLERFIISHLRRNSVSLKAVEFISSIDFKKEECCILEFSEKYEIPFTTFTREQLSQAEGNFTRSEFVQSAIGIDNVCERSAVLQSKGRLIIEKTAYKGMTFAAAMSDWRCIF